MLCQYCKGTIKGRTMGSLMRPKGRERASTGHFHLHQPRSACAGVILRVKIFAAIRWLRRICRNKRTWELCCRRIGCGID